ncbi:MAG: DEAD/DEAH box helicase [Jhaorihella sp.]
MLARIENGRILLPLTETYAPAAAVPDREFIPEYNGRIAVPYTPDHIKIINRLCETELPGPVFAHWKYPGIHQPYLHQRTTADFLTQCARAFVLSGMGSGKTSSALWAAEWLREAGLVRRVLIFSPLSTLRIVWEKELFTIRPMLRMAVAHGSKLKREKAIQSDSPYVVTNHDSIRLKDMDPLELAKLFDLVIVDEVSIFKTWSSGGMPTRYKNMLKLAHAVPRFWGLTGTPTPNSPLDAWALIKLVDKNFKIGKTAFQTRTMYQVSEFKWLPKPDASTMVASMLQPAIRFSKAQVMKYLPPKVFTMREVELTSEQTALRKKLKAEAVAEFKGKQITAANAAVLIGKFLQISAGVVLAEESEPVLIDCAPRYNELKNLLAEGQGKALVFGIFTATVKRLMRDLKNDGYRVGMVYGGTALGARTDIFRKFQETDELDVIVAHPGTMAHGITLTAADLVVWFTPVMSNELFEQANDRPHRPGQKRTVTIARIVATPEERRVFERLEGRAKVQDSVLDIVEDLVE